jgi:hypothetical protein
MRSRRRESKSWMTESDLGVVTLTSGYLKAEFLIFNSSAINAQILSIQLMIFWQMYSPILPPSFLSS